MNEIGSLKQSSWPKEMHADGGKERFRGQPLVLLGIVLASWVGARAMLSEVPLPGAFEVMTGGLLEEVQAEKGFALIQNSGSLRQDGFTPITTLILPSSKPVHKTSSQFAVSDQKPANAGPFLANTRISASQNVSPAQFTALQSAASHQLLWMAAMAHLPIPAVISSAFQDSGQLKSAAQGALSAPIALTSKSSADRWSLDAWAFWREGSGAALRAPGRLPTYGVSQAGAVLRYAISPNSATRPRAYVRAYSSLRGDTEQEIAAGLSARPIKGLPLRLHAEARALHASGKTSARAAGFVTTEIPPVKLPIGLNAEVYGQAGYVTGASATPFADGQLHIMRGVAGFDLAAAKDTKFKIGAAAFAGAQKGARRLDIGPSMRLETRIADTPARLSVDWRQRVAGDAEPGSGLALTLSTRF
ncbi:MAG: hypothetical protein ABJP34_11850 [Erythrobacter sp.]